MEDSSTVLLFSLFGLFSALGGIYFLLRCCWVQGAQCLTRNRIDDRTVLITEADSGVGIELVRELARRGARVIMAVKDIEMATDVAVEVRGETNGEILVEYCDMGSIKSIMEFCTKVLEQESRLHILVNNACVMWWPWDKTAEGHEMHWGVNHLGAFVMTQLLMPLLHRGAPDARIITVSSSWYRYGSISWEDPNFLNRKYSAFQAFNQSKLANVLFTRELARRLEGTGVNSYCVNPGVTTMGLGRHIVKGLGCFGLSAALLCWLPWVKYSEHAMQTILHCATEPALKDQTGLYYSDCAVQVTRNNAANLEDARRLWEMSDRMARLTS